MVLEKTNLQIIDDFLSTKKSEQTKKVYRVELQKFANFVNKSFDEVTNWDIIDFNKVLMANSKSDATRQRIYSTIRSLYTWLVKMHVISAEQNPTNGTIEKLTPHVDLENKFLTVKEVEAFKEKAKPNARNYAMVAVLATTGLRISEALGINWNDIVYLETPEGSGWFASVTRKGGKKQNIFLPDGTYEALMRLRRNIPINPKDDSPVFTSLFAGQHKRITATGARKTLEQIAKAAGIEKEFTPHWFRHTFVSQCIAAGANPRDVQWQAGHSSFRTTERYLHAMSKGVGKFFPVKF